MKKNAVLLLLISIVLFLALSLLIGASSILIKHFTYNSVEREITKRVTEIEGSLKYTNNKWAMAQYNVEPEEPLYIITTDGFIIERHQPIHGLLDSSQHRHLLAFQEPQNMSTVTNDQWRVLSKPIVRRGKTYGIIFVANHNPEELLLESIDAKLTETTTNIDRNISIVNDEPDASKVDVKKLPDDISLEIVTTFNKTILKSGRGPTFIDPSYIKNELNRVNSTRIVRDQVTKEKFLVSSHSIVDKSNHPLALIVAGESVSFADSILRNYLRTLAVLGSLALLPTSVALLYLSNRHFDVLLKEQEKLRDHRQLPKKLSFNNKTSILTLDNEEFHIPHVSNQYYVCESIFQKPKKRWTQDEILDRMGETESTTSSRKVYDATLAINKKVGFKLVDYKDKTLSLNHDLVDAIV